MGDVGLAREEGGNGEPGDPGEPMEPGEPGERADAAPLRPADGERERERSVFAFGIGGDARQGYGK
jgi:hypothetical protein